MNRRAAVVFFGILGVAVSAPNAAFAASPKHVQAQLTHGALSRRPVILSVGVRSIAGFPLPASGAPVTVTAHVRRATICTFLAQRTPVSALYAVRTIKCASGLGSIRVPAIANHRAAVATLRFEVQVGGPGGTAQKSVAVKEKAAVATTSPSDALSAILTLSPPEIPAAGGTVVATVYSTNAASCTLATTPALWGGANPDPVDCNGNYNLTVAASTVGGEWDVTLTATDADGDSATSTQLLTQDGTTTTGTRPPAVGQTSSNWSGYILEGQSLFTEAGGSWTVPFLNCADTPDAGAATWVGIGGNNRVDGTSSGALLQTGIETNCDGGVETAFPWFEEVPASPDHVQTFNGFPVAPGDRVAATVFMASTGAWETRVDDLSTGLSGVMVTGEGWGVLRDGATSFVKQGSTVGLAYGGGYTAEWIEEDYEQAGQLVRLANFGTVTFTNLTTSLPAGWTMPSSSRCSLIDAGGNLLASPSGFANDGFSVAYAGP